MKDANCRPNIEDTVLFDFVLERKKVLLEVKNNNNNKSNYVDRKKVDLKIQVKKSELEKNHEMQKNNKVESNNNRDDVFIINDNKYEINSKNTGRNLNISMINSAFNKFNNLSEANNNKISSKSARSSSACMISSAAGIKSQSNLNAENPNYNNNYYNILSPQNNLNEGSSKLEKFITTVENNDNKKANYSFTNTNLASIIKKIENNRTPVNFQCNFFQCEKQTKTTTSQNNSNHNNNNAEYKNINKFLNVSNNNLNKGILITDKGENTDNNNKNNKNNNNNSFIEENSGYILKTHSDIKTNKKKVDFDIINNCMESFLEIEKNLDIKQAEDRLISKTPLNSKISNLNKDFYELKEKTINEQDLNSKILLTNEGSKTTKNFTFVQNNHTSNINKICNSSKQETNKKENNCASGNNQIDKANKKPNIPISVSKEPNCNAKKVEFEDLKFNINYEFDLYSQHNDLLNNQHHQLTNPKNISITGNSKSPERLSYSDIDYFENAEKPNFESKINTPNTNSIQVKAENINKNKGLSLQESKLNFLILIKK